MRCSLYAVAMRTVIDAETFRAVSLPILTGLLVRAIPVLTTDFPLNDGGLFYAMTRDLQAANFLLPATTSYNGLDIPFAYPPLGFYLAGLLSSAFGIGLLDIFRFLPLIVATLMIPVVHVLAREILPSRFQALLATWAFALLPRSFDWLIAGGGLTRGLGLLFALLAIREGIRFYRTGQRRHGFWMAILAALTALSHPQAALFTGISMVLVLLAFDRTRRALRHSVVLAALAALVAAPWWLTVVLVHGIAPFVSGSQTSTDLDVTFQHLATFTFTDEPYTTFLAVIGLIGLLHQVALRRYLLPAWIVAVFVVDPRGAATNLMAPLAMLIAVAVDEVLLARLSGPRERLTDGPLWPSTVVRDRFGRLLLAVGLTLGLFGAVKASGLIGSPLHALPASNRAAMDWIAANAPPSAEFVVVSGNLWFIDAASEWFPVLAGHRSVATLQGYEWLGKDGWFRQAGRYETLQQCVYETPDCVTKWAREASVSTAWIYLPVSTTDTLSPSGDCCAGFRAALAASPAYTVVYRGEGGIVLRPRL